MKNIFIFIIWEKARWCEKKIINDIENNFKLLDKVEIEWEKEKFESNLNRFYGHKIPYNSDKMKHCGTGKFLLIVVSDESPSYQWKKTSAGNEYVNARMFDKKTLYRKWTGGGHRIHCSNSGMETRHDLFMLLGIDIEEADIDIFPISHITQNVVDIASIDKLEMALKCSNPFYWKKIDDIYIVICECREDVKRMLNAEIIKDGIYSVCISDKTVYIYIFGYLEGDISKKCLHMIKEGNKETLSFFEDYFKEYSSVIWDNKRDKRVEHFLIQYEWDKTLLKTDVVRKASKESMLIRIYHSIKEALARVTYPFVRVMETKYEQ